MATIEYEAAPGYILIIEADLVKHPGNGGLLVGVIDIIEKDTEESLTDDDAIDFLTRHAEEVTRRFQQVYNNSDKSLN